MRRIYPIVFTVSLIVLAASIVMLAVWGLELGVDFRGGSMLTLRFTERPAPEQVSMALDNLHIDALKGAIVSTTGASELTIKSPALDEQQHQAVLKGLSAAFPKAGVTEDRFDSVGPAIGEELKSSSVMAIVVSLILIALYIAFVFRSMSRVLSWWAMSVATMVALAHDVLLPLGLFAFLGHMYGTEISAVFVAAILTIMGYSITDTVVVFDRVRENIVRGRLAKGASFGEVVHQSIMETLVRSINTNITVLMSLVAIYFFGGASIRSFSLALIVGIFSGAYSSIFVASPLLVWLGNRGKN